MIDVEFYNYKESMFGHFTLFPMQHGIRHNLRHSIGHEGFCYTLNRRTADGQTYWRCHNRACPGRVVTDINDQLVSCNDKHTHQPNTTEIAIERVKENVKKRAKDKTTPIPQMPIGIRWVDEMVGPPGMHNMPL